MSNQLEKINLIYIASTGRSGSTLLDMLLGSHFQIATAGEIQILPHEILHHGFMPCGCGKSVSQCCFWQQVSSAIEPFTQPQPQIHYFREQHNAGKTIRWQHLLEFYNSHILESKQEQIKTYGHNNYQLFKAFLDVVEEKTMVRPSWIVDASKDPYRLLWLAKSNLFNLKVLHLVKNPKAFSYSMTRRILKQDKFSLDAYKMTIRKSISWLIHNHFISQIAEQHLDNSNYLLINYENLASNPEEIFKTSLELINCQADNNLVEDFKNQIIHTIAGNPMRYKPRKIVLDEAWKKSFPLLHRKTVDLISAFGKAKYGY